MKGKFLFYIWIKYAFIGAVLCIFLVLHHVMLFPYEKHTWSVALILDSQQLANTNCCWLGSLGIVEPRLKIADTYFLFCFFVY